MEGKSFTSRQADILWHRLVAYQFNQRCAMCGRPGTDPHHWWFGRSALQYRWDINNGIYLCRKCHDEVKTKPDKVLDMIAERYPVLWAWSQTRPPLVHRCVSEGHVWDVYNELLTVTARLGISTPPKVYMPKYFIGKKKRKRVSKHVREEFDMIDKQKKKKLNAGEASIINTILFSLSALVALCLVMESMF